MFDLIVRCREFSDFTLRVNEKRLLNALNDTPIRFPRAGRIKTREDKISCLLQAVLGNVPIASPTLAQESLKMIRIGDRIAKCLLEYMRLSEHQAHTSTGTFPLGRYKALLHTVTIAKCFHAKLWENSAYAAKQLQKIGGVYSAQLVCAGKTTLKSLEATDARIIEAILNKPYPFGDEILQNLQQAFPEYSLQLEHQSPSMVRVCVRQVNEAFICRGVNAMIIVGDSANQLLLFIEDLDTLLQEYGFFMKTIILPSTEVEKVHAHVIHATLVGVDVHETLIINEPPEEAITIQKPKQNRKRKQQTILTAASKKKVKPNTSSTMSTIFDTTINSTVANKSKRFANLQSFAFSKSKLNNDTIGSTINDNCKELLNKTSNETVLNISDKSNLHNSTLVQTKLTHFFTQKKNVTADKSVLLEVDYDRRNDKLKAEAEKQYTDKTPQDMTLNSTLETTLMKFQKISKQNDIEFDKLKESQEKSKNELNKCIRRVTSVDLTESSKHCFVDQSNSKEKDDETKTESQLILSSTLRATTPDLHEISAFLDTQKSAPSQNATQRSNKNEQQEVSTNRQDLNYIVPNGTQTSKIFDTPNSIRSLETTPDFNNLDDSLRNRQTSVCGIEIARSANKNVGESYEEANYNTAVTEGAAKSGAKCTHFENSRDNEMSNVLHNKSAHVNISTLNPKIMNCGISNTMQKELVERSRSRSLNLSNEPLNLSRATAIIHVPNERHANKAAFVHKYHPTQRINIDSNNLKQPSTKSQRPKCNEVICGLDLTRKSITYSDDNTRDDASAMSTSVTSKSSDTLKNTPKNIENYLLSYKCAVAFSRLSQEQRTIINYKKIYKRLWHTSSAIDFITQKLSKSSISHGAQQKRITERRIITRRDIRRDPRRTIAKNNITIAKKEPLNLSNRQIQQQKIKDTVTNASSKPASKISHLSKEEQHKILTNKSTKADESTSSMLRNPYRLQLLNDSKNEVKSAHHINNEVMHLVLDMKCKAVSIAAEDHLIAGADGEEDLENVDMQSLPSMSFEEYCSYVLQATHNADRRC
ncbi:uncharacterized protein LOC110118719 [Ceratitis capitata]|uniref:uncharacterized protein LOC110118719 n=1 Tax=Ceratitis capitata TaxID=7213 RepID=UPI000A10D479|nr:uncharacterized protein LOC110118719 [Ceratitis capitata]